MIFDGARWLDGEALDLHPRAALSSTRKRSPMRSPPGPTREPLELAHAESLREIAGRLGLLVGREHERGDGVPCACSACEHPRRGPRCARPDGSRPDHLHRPRHAAVDPSTGGRGPPGPPRGSAARCACCDRWTVELPPDGGLEVEVRAERASIEGLLDDALKPRLCAGRPHGNAARTAINARWIQAMLRLRGERRGVGDRLSSRRRRRRGPPAPRERSCR